METNKPTNQTAEGLAGPMREAFLTLIETIRPADFDKVLEGAQLLRNIDTSDLSPDDRHLLDFLILALAGSVVNVGSAMTEVLMVCKDRGWR